MSTASILHYMVIGLHRLNSLDAFSLFALMLVLTESWNRSEMEVVLLCYCVAN